MPPGVDLETFRPLERPRRGDMILAIGRANALKRFDLTASAWRLLEEPRPQLCVFGVEPEIAPPGSVHINGPSDDEVNELLNACAVFVQTSSHEGFASKHGLNVPLLADVDKRVAQAYDAFSPRLGVKRAVIVIDEQGVVRYRHDHLLGLDYQSVDDLKDALTRVPSPAA